MSWVSRAYPEKLPIYESWFLQSYPFIDIPHRIGQYFVEKNKFLYHVFLDLVVLNHLSRRTSTPKLLCLRVKILKINETYILYDKAHSPLIVIYHVVIFSCNCHRLSNQVMSLSSAIAMPSTFSYIAPNSLSYDLSPHIILLAFLVHQYSVYNT